MQKLIISLIVGIVISGGYIGNIDEGVVRGQFKRQESELFNEQGFLIVPNNTTYPETQVLGVKTDKPYYNLLAGKEWDADLMYRIMECESSLNPRAYNPEWHRGCQGSYGLFQVACVHGYSNLYDPESNVEAAYRVWQEAGGSYRPWTNCYNMVK